MKPFVKTVLYYYLKEYLGVDIPHSGIRLIDEPLFDDEITNPYPEEKMEKATPFYPVKNKEFFRFIDGGIRNGQKAHFV